MPRTISVIRRTTSWWIFSTWTTEPIPWPSSSSVSGSTYECNIGKLNFSRFTSPVFQLLHAPVLVALFFQSYMSVCQLFHSHFCLICFSIFICSLFQIYNPSFPVLHALFSSFTGPIFQIYIPSFPVLHSQFFRPWMRTVRP